MDRWDRFDLAEIAGKVVTDRRQEAARRGIRLDAALSAAPATGDPSLAESLVAILVDNALRHNRAEGQVEVTTETKTGRPVISVGNTGEPISPDDVDRLFQPFQRLDSERTGHDGRATWWCARAPVTVSTGTGPGGPGSPSGRPAGGATSSRSATGRSGAFIYLDPDYAGKDTQRYPWLPQP